VTNYHVVEDAVSVEVQLRDQRTFPARVVASDEPSDVAVLKIAATDLPALPWGDSDKVEVGEQVFAIGNPFDLDDSVSKGIVSAKGRNLPDSNELRGLYPDRCRDQCRQLGRGADQHPRRTDRDQRRDRLVYPGQRRRRLFHSEQSRALRRRGAAQGRAAGAGLSGGQAAGENRRRRGRTTGSRCRATGRCWRGSCAVLPPMAKLRPVDFITEVDGHKIDGVAQLRLIVAQIPIGKEVVVNYIRAGAARSTTVKIAELPKEAKNVKADQSVVLLVHHGRTSGDESNSSSFIYLAPQS
jgi:serine protease Do